jgi:acyl-CoA thioester hydrolase
MPFVHQLRVRYAEVDAQGVVFNAHWLTYADDAATRFFEHAGFAPAELWGPGAEAAWDVMVRRSELDFAGAAGFDELVDITVTPIRVGTSSFDLTMTSSVAGRPAVTVTSTYVTVVPGQLRSQPIPDDLRAALTSDLHPATPTSRSATPA